METLGYLLALVTAVWLWDSKLHMSLWYVTNDAISYNFRYKWMCRLDKTKLGKMLWCATCLSFWLGLISFLVVGDIFLLSLPLAYKGVIKLIS
jgi:hypothetical protein